MIAHLCIYHILQRRKRRRNRISERGFFRCKTHSSKLVFFSQIVIKVLEGFPGFAVVAYLEELDAQLHNRVSGGWKWRDDLTWSGGYLPSSSRFATETSTFSTSSSSRSVGHDRRVISMDQIE